MNLNKLLKNEIVKGLSGNSFKAYCVLLNESKNGKIENFTILGLSKKWKNDESLNMVSGKNTVKGILRELEELGLIYNNQEKKVLNIK